MDILSLGLGVAGMVKSYRAASRTLKGFAQADREFARLRKLLDAEGDIFRIEINILLRLVLILDDADIQSMLDDSEHEMWKSSELHQALESFYGRSSNSFRGYLDEIKSNMTYLLEELVRCSDLDPSLLREAGRGRMERTTQWVHRFGSAAKLAFDRKKCDKAMKGLWTATRDLEHLRRQVQTLKRGIGHPGTGRDSTTTSMRHLSGRLPNQCVKIGRAARALHKGLADALPGHQVRLFLDTTTEKETTCTNLAIACGRAQAPGLPSIFRVHSQPTCISSSPESQDTSPETQGTLPQSKDGNIVESSFKRRGNPGDTQPPESSFATIAVSDMQGTIKGRPGTRPSKNLCSNLCKGKLPVCRGQNCLCFIETAGDLFRHEFHPPGRKYTQPEWQHVRLGTFDNVLQVPVKTTIEIAEQLKLARSIASAVLYLSSTRWLAEHWGSKDLSFFLDRKIDLAKPLRTVNFVVDFPPDPKSNPSAMEVYGVMTPPPSDRDDVEEAALLHGLRNLTLYSLGVTLLQIGNWQSFQADDVVQVRKLARQDPPLGSRYGLLTEKCLYCDFGCGAELSKPQLQDAVYRNVVEELDEMIRSLDLSVSLDDDA